MPKQHQLTPLPQELFFHILDYLAPLKVQDLDLAQPKKIRKACNRLLNNRCISKEFDQQIQDYLIAQPKYMNCLILLMTFFSDEQVNKQIRHSIACFKNPEYVKHEIIHSYYQANDKFTSKPILGLKGILPSPLTVLVLGSIMNMGIVAACIGFGLDLIKSKPAAGYFLLLCAVFLSMLNVTLPLGIYIYLKHKRSEMDHSLAALKQPEIRRDELSEQLLVNKNLPMGLTFFNRIASQAQQSSNFEDLIQMSEMLDCPSKNRTDLASALSVNLNTLFKEYKLPHLQKRFFPQNKQKNVIIEIPNPNEKTRLIPK